MPFTQVPGVLHARHRLDPGRHMWHRTLLAIGFVLIVTACSSAEGDSPPATGSGDAAAGTVVYDQTCVACHGPGGVGVEGLGKPWVDSEFINSRTDSEMLVFLIEGRASDHPENTTGIAMMPRGGNPNLTDDDLLDLIAYMRTLNLDG